MQADHPISVSRGGAMNNPHNCRDSNGRHWRPDGGDYGLTGTGYRTERKY